MAHTGFIQRAHWHDYSAPGWYYLGFHTRKHIEVLGSHSESGPILNANADIVRRFIEEAPERYPFFQTDSLLIEPSRVQMLIEILEHRFPARPEYFDTYEEWLHYRRVMGTSLLVGNIKTGSAKEINLANGWRGTSLWNRRYVDRILEDEEIIAAVRHALRNGLPVTMEMLKPKHRNTSGYLIRAAEPQPPTRCK